MLRYLLLLLPYCLLGQEVNFTAHTDIGKSIQFYDASIDIDADEWLWSFGDGTSSTEQNPIHNYANEGTYEVCLTVNDTYSLCKNDVFKITENGVVVKYDETQWPNGQATIISSPFGPRYKFSEDRYDYHRGIDIPGQNGDPVYNIADGVVYNTYEEADEDSPYDSTVVIVKHEMETPIYFHGKFITTYYSLSMHLNEIADGIEKGVVVNRGAQIGTVGQTGATTFDHNHFEIRLGVVCSKEAQEDGFCQYKNPYDEPTDTHVNPLLFLDYEMYNTNTLECNILQTNPLKLEIISDRPELDFNRIEVLYNGDEKIMDLNERIGIDPDNIDNDIYDELYIDPDEFTSQGGQDYRLELTFDGLENVDKVRIKDVWGHRGVFQPPVLSVKEKQGFKQKLIHISHTGFSLVQSDGVAYVLYDMDGKEADKGNIYQSKGLFSSKIISGTYVLKVLAQSEVYRLKVVL